MKAKHLLLFIILIAVTGYFVLSDEPKRLPANTQQFITVLNEERKKAGEPLIANINKELWYKNSFIYTLDVEVFKDSDGDDTGDFKGLISKLDYIKSLGADIIWLAPFQPTANRMTVTI